MNRGFVVGLRLGSAPDARHYFLLSCQKKVSKENARPQRRPATPGSLRCSAATGGLRNSGLRPSDSPRPFSRCVLRCSTTQRADRKPSGDRPQMASGSVRCVFPPPSCSAEQRRRAGGSRRGLSEGEARVPQPPGLPSSAGHPAKPGAQRGGRLLFGNFFLATQEKVTRRQGGTKRFRILPQHPPSKRPKK